MKTLCCRFDKYIGLVTGLRMPLTRTGKCNGDVAMDLYGPPATRSGGNSVLKD